MSSLVLLRHHDYSPTAILKTASNAINKSILEQRHRRNVFILRFSNQHYVYFVALTK